MSLREGDISKKCGAGSLNISNGAIGACQIKTSSGCSGSSCVHVLGYLGGNVSSISLVDGVVTAEYRWGDQCNHGDNLFRQAVSML